MAGRSVVAVVGATAAFVLALGVGSAAAVPRDTTPPTQPTNLRVTDVTQTTVSLAWGPSTDNVKVTNYVVWRPFTPGLPPTPQVWVPASQTSATVTALRINATYTFYVSAYDGRNFSPQAEVTVTTQRELVPPTAPSGLRLSTVSMGVPVDGVTASTVLLEWTRSTDDVGPVTYDVLVNGVPSPNTWDTLPAGSPSPPGAQAWVRQLEPGTTYQLAVRARDGSDNVSAASNTVTVTTDPSSDVVAPTTPTLTSANIGSTGMCPDEIWVWWTPSTDDTDTSLEYEIRVNGTIIDVATGARWITYTDVHGPITVTLVAVDRAGNASAPSNSMSGYTNWGEECPA